MKAAVEDGLYLPLLLAIDNDSRRWWCNLSWTGVIGGVFPERDVENRVDLDSGEEA